MTKYMFSGPRYLTNFQNRVPKSGQYYEKRQSVLSFASNVPRSFQAPPRRQRGPLNQATGPPRSGAGVGIGLLRGAGDSLLGIEKLVRFTKFSLHVF